MLLIPEVVELDPAEAERLVAAAAALAALGLVLEAFGPGAVLVREVPAAARRADVTGLVARPRRRRWPRMGAAALALEERLDDVLLDHGLPRLACAPAAASRPRR